MSNRSFASHEICQLDFSGGPCSWFDLWHIHLPEDAVDDLHRATKRDDIVALTEVYDELNDATKFLTVPYQIFILIVPSAYRENAVYLHTENPNGTPFPHVLEEEYEVGLSTELSAPLPERGMDILPFMTDERPVYYAFKRSIGFSLGG